MNKKTPKVIIALVLILSMIFNPLAFAIQTFASESSGSTQNSLQIETKNDIKDSSTNTLSVKFRVRNITDQSINLKDVKVRYYYTVEADKTQMFYCDWATVGSNNLTGTFHKTATLYENADSYLEIGFSADSGSLEPGKYVEIHTRIANVDWSNYNQSNDYSFTSEATDFQPWDKVTAYLNNRLIWGEEPVTQASEQTSVQVKTFNEIKSAACNTLVTKYRIYNTSNHPIKLSDLTVRYYYTVDTDKTQVFFCDWSNIGAQNVSGTFIELDSLPTTGDADHYLELGFTEKAGTLGAEQYVEIHTRIANADWSPYNQDNDYSYNGESTDLTIWDKVPAYLNGMLISGQTPTTKTINITSPSNNSIIKKPKTDVTGKIYGSYQNLIIKMNGLQCRADESGNFVIPNVLLASGRNVLEIKVFDGDTFLGMDKVYVTCDLSEASESIDPQNGGHVEVKEPSSPIFGAAMDFPGGAVENAINAKIAYDPDKTPALKLGEKAVGPVVIFNPIGEKFKTAVTLTLPVDSSLLPSGSSVNDICVYALSDLGLTNIPVIARAAGSVKVKVTSLEYGYFLPVVATPTSAGQVRIITQPANATIYIDGYNTQKRSPATLTTISAGSHTLKLYLPGYNEIFKTITVPSNGTILNVTLVKPTGALPAVSLDSSLQDGMNVTESLFRVYGTTNQASGLAVISLNGWDTITPINADGSFSDYVSLAEGTNTLQVRVNNADGTTGTSSKITIKFSPASTVTSLTAPTDNVLTLTTASVNRNSNDISWIKFNAGEQQGSVPSIQLDSSVYDGMTVYVTTYKLSGKVDFKGSSQNEGIINILLNGNNQIVEADQEGKFTCSLSLLPGENSIDIRAQNSEGNIGTCPSFKIINESSSKSRISALATESLLANNSSSSSNNQNVRVILSWNTNSSDVDLHLFDPSGRHCYYGALSTIPNGRLDHDDTDGYGPEIFTMDSPNPGTYTVTVDYYDAHGAGATTASLRVYVGEKLEYSGNYTFSSYDHNATNGRGSSNSAFWDACQFTIEDNTLEITEVKTLRDSSVDSAVFTTAPGENTVSVKVSASDSINDEDIHYEIKEVNEGYTVDTSSLTGREITFNATHTLPTSWSSGSQPLTYEITAYTLNEDGERELTSNSVTLTQDAKSQIRQEYIDKKNLDSEFNLPTPDYEAIKSREEFPTDSPYSFECFSNDHYPGYTILDDSLYLALKNIKERLGAAAPDIVGAWYNPRKNDNIEKDKINSLHQSGEAVDLAASHCQDYWPEGADTYEEATACLLGVILTSIDLSKFNAYLEKDHVHLEKALPSGWYSLQPPDEFDISQLYMTKMDLDTDKTAGEYVITLVNEGSEAIGYVFIDDEWVQANGTTTGLNNLKVLNNTYGSYRLQFPGSITVKINEKVNQLIVTFLNKMNLNRADLDEEDIDSIIGGIAFSADDNVLLGLLQKICAKVPPDDNYYFSRSKSYTDAVFIAWFLKSSLGSAAAAANALTNAGVAQCFAIATSETVVVGGALEVAAVEEAARAGVLTGVSVAFAAMANRSKGILQADVETLKSTIGYKIRNVADDILDRFEGYKGGHTIKEHVAKTNEELIKRANDPKELAPAATSYTNKSTAIKAVKQNLRKNADTIEHWLKNSSSKPTKSIEFIHSYDIGKGVYKDTKNVIYGLKKSKVVLVKDVDSYLGFRIVTSYPAL